MRRPLTAALLAHALLTAPAAAQMTAATLPDSVTRRIDRVFAQYDRPGSPGCALGVYQGGRIAYARGYGYANLEWEIPNTPQTVFDIGSTSKQFTAFAIALLAERGKLSLDDEVRKHIPELPSYPTPVTIRHLLTHTSGLRDYLALMDLHGTDFDGVTTMQDALDLIVRQGETNFTPGSEFLYSNTGFLLLSEIVRRVSGRPMRAFAEAEIFGPLGMAHTHVHDDHTMVVPHRATGYAPAFADQGGGKFVISMSGFEQTGDGAVMTTVEDLLRWDENFYAPRVGSAALLATLQTPGVLTTGDTLSYGAGLFVGTMRGRRYVRHGGSWAGYRADLLRFPDQHTSVACLCNLGTADPGALADEVAAIVLGDEPARVAAAPAAARAPNASRWQPTAGELSALAGSYRNPTTEAVRQIAVKDGRLVARLGGRDVLLTPLERYRFEAEGVQAELEFEPPRGQSPARLRERDDARGTAVYEAFRPAAPTAADLAEYAGDYYSRELDATYRFTAERGRLTLRRPRDAEHALQPTRRDVFVAGSLAVIFLRDAQGRVTGATLNAGRVRNLRFERKR